MSLEEHEEAKTVARGRPTLKEKQFELRENMILDVATDVLMQKGISVTTLDDVIAEVGISKPTFYQHFKSKEDLFTSVIRRAIKEATEMLYELERTLPADEAVRAMIDWALHKHFEQADLCYYDLVGTLSVLANDSLRAPKLAMTVAFGKLIERAQLEGKARQGIPAILLAQIILSVFKDSGYQDILSEGLIDSASFRAGIADLVLVPARICSD